MRRELFEWMDPSLGSMWCSKNRFLRMSQSSRRKNHFNICLFYSWKPFAHLLNRIKSSWLRRRYLHLYSCTKPSTCALSHLLFSRLMLYAVLHDVCLDLRLRCIRAGENIVSAIQKQYTCALPQTSLFAWILYKSHISFEPQNTMTTTEITNTMQCLHLAPTLQPWHVLLDLLLFSQVTLTLIFSWGTN